MELSSTDGTFPIKIVDQAQKVSYDFEDAVQLRNFVAAEAQYWGRLVGALVSAKVLSVPLSGMLQAAGHAAAKSAVTMLGRSKSDDASIAAATKYAAASPILSEGTYGPLLEEAAKSEPRAVPGLARIISDYINTNRSPQQPAGEAVSQQELDTYGRGMAAFLRFRESGQAQTRAVLDAIADSKTQSVRAEKAAATAEQWFKERREAIETPLAAAMKSVSTLQNELRTFTDKTKGEIEGLRKETSAELQRIQTLYMSNQVLEGPSELWKVVRRKAALGTTLSLSAFILLIGIPLLLLCVNFTAVGEHFTVLFKDASPTSYLTIAVTLTLPAFAYGWLLRHISRLFIHNLTLESDAHYREVLARTFLGLAENKSVGVSDAERALVINALFRPTPPNAVEDGPPSGLLDLISRKP